MSMDMSATSTTVSAAEATTSAMSMSMGDRSSCKVSALHNGAGQMLWNWNTIDTCFISSSWHVTSSGMFAGSCIGVILLVMSLEFLRRTVKEYDSYLVRTHATKREASFDGKDSGFDDGFRPSVFQQAVRASLHMVQFAVAYFVMLSVHCPSALLFSYFGILRCGTLADLQTDSLAMYYNGYLIICIFIGAFLGAFLFQWEVLGRGPPASATKEATVCCG
ncbi:putative Ctr copper transporter family-domain-containing protein [Seiridium cardinale]